MLKVTDLMKKDVVTVRPEDSARALARVLADSEISGVPVVDSSGRVVGVVSATDLGRLAADFNQLAAALERVRHAGR